MAVVNGTNKSDSLVGTVTDDTISAGNGNDVVGAGGGDDTVYGGNGSDTIDAGDGSDLVYGGNGEDLIYAGDGNDIAYGNNGDDTLDGGAGDDELYGGNGNDTLDGGAGSDVVYGDKGDDTAIYVLSENTGQTDIYDGGKGHDTLRIVLTDAEAASAAVQADIAAYQSFLSSNSGGTFAFTSFDLTVSSFETLEVVVVPDDTGYATITQYAAGNFNWEILEPAFFSPGFGFDVETVGAVTANGFTAQNLSNTDLTIVFAGSGLTYGPGSMGANTPQGGTINSVTFMDGSTVLAVLDGLNEDAVGLIAALETYPTDGHAAFDAIMDGYEVTFDASAAAGNAGANLFAQDDTFVGGAGNDHFRGGAGTDSYDGGSGGDDAIAFEFETGGNGVTIDLAAGTTTDTYGNNETFVNIEKVWGSQYDDTMYGNAGNNLFQGEGGDDVIDGRDGYDTVWYRSEVYHGGVGGVDVNLATGIGLDSFGNVDTLINIESVAGTDFDDVLVGDGNDNDFMGFAGSDSFDGGGGNNAVSFQDETGGVGAVVDLALGTGTDTYGDADTFANISRLHGSVYDDTFLGTGASELFEGRAGDDTIDGRGGHDVLYYLSDVNFGGTAGVYVDLANDTVIDAFGDTDTVYNIENVTGTNQADTFIGDELDNGFAGYEGADTYQGGDGQDAVDFERETGGSGVTVNLAAMTGTDTYGNVETYLGSIEKVWASQWADTLIGDSADNLFHGNDGADFMNGGSGNDLAWYYGEVKFGGVNGINANLAAGTIVDSFGNTDTVVSIENVAGTDQADVFVGDGNDNNFIGFDGADTYTGGAGSDGVEYNQETGASGVFVDLAAGTATDTYGNAETLISIERVNGSNNDDTIIGNADNNTFRGFDGADSYDGGAGSDRVSYQSEDGLMGVVANLTTGVGTDTWGNAEAYVSIERLRGSRNDDDLTGSGNGDRLEGREGNDGLYGLAGDDDLFGQDGDDTLVGGTGNDYLEGGGGADTFVFTAGDGYDWIEDFDFFEGDRIDLSAYGFTSTADFYAPPSFNGSETTLHLSATDEIVLNGIDPNNLGFDPEDAFIWA